MPRPPYPLPAVVDPVYEIVLQGFLSDGGGGAKKAYSVFYYRLTGPATGVNKANLSTIFGSTVVAPLLLATCTRYSPVRTAIRNIQDVGDMAQLNAVAGAGNIATDSLPSDDAVVCLLTSATRGRMCRGRKHFPGGAESSTTLDILNAGGVTLWAAVRDVLPVTLADSDGNVYTPFIFSRSYSVFSPTVTIYGANVTGATLLKTIGTMRKRRTPTVYA